MPRLPGTYDQARQLQALYRAHREPVVLLTGSHAGETQLKALGTTQSQVPRVLHLATYGTRRTADNGEPARPMTQEGLALAGANLGRLGLPSPTGDDGILDALEAQDLNLAGIELVTLSAGQSGMGSIDAREGVSGFVRAFQLAGDRNVLVTLWCISDSKPADFMADFYGNWLEGNAQDGPADALRATQIDWISSGDPAKADPRHWAAYVLIERR